MKQMTYRKKIKICFKQQFTLAPYLNRAIMNPTSHRIAFVMLCGAGLCRGKAPPSHYVSAMRSRADAYQGMLLRWHERLQTYIPNK